ncbi:MAG: peptide deformylase [Candidatus Latescibacterota bacterium]
MASPNFKLRFFGDPILRKSTEKVTVFDPELKDFVDAMSDALYEENGLGLAAPQVGDTRKIVIIDLSFGEEVENTLPLINPEFLSREGECVMEEGCLSIPGIFEGVSRPEKIRVRYQDITGATYEIEADGLLARIIQHEMDHLEGILFIDHLSSVKKLLLTKALREISEENGDV